MATKDGPTKKIQFMKTDKECSYLEKIVVIDSDDLMLGEYSLDPKDYLEDEYLSRMMDGSCVEWKIMKDICDIKNGIPGFYQITKYYDNSGTIKLIRGINLREEETNYQYLNNDAKDIIAKNLMKTDEILYADASHKNLCKIVPNEWDGLSHVGCLRLTKFNDVNYKYIYNFIKSEIFDTIRKKYERGATISHFPRHIFENVKIPLPSLPIQQKIVTELDQLEEHTKALKQLLEHTKKAKEMYERYGMIKEIRELLNGCEWKKLGEVFTLVKGKTQSSNVKEDPNGNSVFINLSKTSQFKNINNGILNGENIFISNTSPLGLVQYYNGRCDYSNLLYCIVPNIDYIDKIKIKIYYYYLTYFRNHITNNYQKGSANKSLHIDRFNNMLLPVPSLPVQQKCIEVYQQKETVLKDYDKKIEDIENDIKHNQELGRQVIEYYITADVQPDIKESDTEIINEFSDNNDTDMKTISSNKSKSQKKKKQKEHSIESYDDEPEIRVVSKKRKKKVIRREL
jgi:restriction endonuclease S subunit